MQNLKAQILSFLLVLAASLAYAQNNAPSLLTFEAERISVRETVAIVSLNVRKNSLLTEPITFGLSIEPLEGAPADKLVSLESQLTLLPSETGLSLNLLVKDDAQLSGDQTYAVRLYPISLGANQGVLPLEPALIRLIDDEAFAPARLTDGEVEENAGIYGLILALDRPAQALASATIELFSETAKEDQDYVKRRETVLINPGDEGAIFPIDILDDDIFEADERLFARIVQSDSLDVVDFDAEIRIKNDDAPPALSFSATQTSESQTRGTVAVMLDREAGVETSVSFDFRSGTATLGEDFSGVSGTLTFPEGVTRQFINFDVVDDSRDEEDEAFTLTFRDATGLRAPEQALAIAILDDDLAPRLLIDAPDIREGQEGDVRFTLDAPSDKPITLRVQLTSNTALIPEDIRAKEATFTFAPGEMGPQILRLNPIKDEVFEEVETLSLKILEAENLRVREDVFSLAILDSNIAPYIRLAEVRAVEGGEDNGLRFILSKPSSRPARFTLTLEGQEAIAGEDFAAFSEVFSFAEEQTELLIPLTILDNFQNEAEETLTASLSQPEGLQLEQASYPIAIFDDDLAPTLSIKGQESLAENSPDPLILNLELSEISGQDVVLDLELSPKDPTTQGLSGADFEPLPQRLTIPAGQKNLSLTLQPRDDVFFEASEDFTLTLRPLEATVQESISTTIRLIDDDEPPVLTLTAPPLREDAGRAAEAPLFVSLSKPAGLTTTVELGIFEGSAREGLDYEINATHVTIPPGQSSAQIPLSLINDKVYEDEESFEIALLSSNAALIEENLVVITIIDDDDFPQITLTHSGVSEGDGERGLITFALTSASDQPVQLDYALQNGTAILGQDYLTEGGTLTFAPGETERQLDLQIVDDRTFEQDQTLSLSISNLKGADLLEGRQAWDLSLADNDPLPQLRVTDTEVLEAISDAPSPAMITFRLDRRAEVPVAFDYRLAQEGAEGGDLVLEPGTLTFAPGEQVKTLAIQPLQDVIDEDREIYHILLTNAQNVRLPEVAARVTLIDDDPAPDLFILDAMADETSPSEPDGNLLTFLLRLSAPSGRPVTAEVLTKPTIDARNPAEIGTDLAAMRRTVTFAPGETELRVPVQLIADGLDEAQETFIVNILSAQNANLTDAIALGTIRDTDPVPQILADDLAVLESATADAIANATPLPAMRLHLSQASGKDIYVDYVLMPESARLGSDIEPVQGTLIFPAGTIEKLIPLRLLDDDLDEGVETLFLSLSNAKGGSLDENATQSARLTITDDDLGPELLVEIVPVREGQGPDSAVARIALAAPSAQALSLQWEVIAKTAQAGIDFEATSGTLTFQPGQTLGLIPLNILEDTIDELDEEIELLLTSDEIRISAPTTAIVIQDNDPAPAFRLSPAALDEGTQIAQLTLKLDAPAERDLPGTLTLSEATATFGEDFDLPAFDFLIPAGVQELSIPVELTNDNQDEPEERFTLTAQLLVDAVSAPSSAIYTIADDDPEPSLSLIDLEIGEGSEAAMIVQVSEPSGRTITLSYTTMAGSAQESQEFEPQTGTISIPPFTAEARLPLVLLDDTLDEIAETFTVQLTSASKASIARAIGRVTVIDDDPPVRLILGASTKIEAREGSRLSVPLTLAEPSGHPVELELETVSGIAISNEDYVPRVGRVLFEPGQTEASFTIDLIDDGFEESTETFGVKVNSARNADFDPSPLQVAIIDNDRPATLSVEATNMIEAQGKGELRFTLAAESSDVVVIEYDVIDGTAENNIDYALGPGALIFLPGETEKRVSIPLQADGIDEFDETFILTILAANVEAREEQITVRIEDSDPAPELSLLPIIAEEGDGALNLELQLTGTTQKEVSGNLRLSPAGAFAPSLEPQTLPFSIPAGQQSLRLTVPLSDDVYDEFDETLTLILEDTVNTNLPRASFEGTIRNDDPPTALRLVEQSFDEGTPGQVAVEVALDRPSGKPISFDFTLRDDTARSGLDWDGTNGQGLIEPGQERLSIPLTILDDEIYEGDEYFTLALSNLVHGQTVAPQTRYTIVENEAPPRLIINPARVNEGTPLAMPLALDTPSALPLALNVSVSDGSARLGRDLEPVLPQVRFEPGEIEGEILLIPIDDPFDEFEEDLSMTFSAEIIQTPETPLTITLIDNDEAPELAVSNIERLEDASGLLDLSLSIASNKPISFTVIAEADTATLGEDFDFSPQTIRLAPGESQVTLPLTLIDDALDENVETYDLLFSDVENMRLSQDRLTISLIDTDPEPRLEVNDLIMDEGAVGEAALLDIRLSEPSGRPVTLRLASADADALGLVDYDPVAQDVVFAPGETLQRVSLSLVDDALFEVAESFLVTLVGVEHALAPERDVLVTILDNDPQPQLVYTDQTLKEAPGDPAFSVPVGLSGPAGLDITVLFTLEGLKPEQPDLAFDDLILTFPAGETQARLTGRLIDDTRDEADQDLRLIALPGPSFAMPDAPLTLLIRDDDPAPTLRFETQPLSEAKDSTSTVMARLSGPSEKTVTAQLNFADGSAKAGQDFINTYQTLTFAPGQTELSLAIELIDDRIFELEETFDLVLSEPSEVRLPQPRTRLTVFDDDPQPTLSIRAAALSEGEAIEAELKLDAPSSQQVSLTYALTSDTAREGQDFLAQRGTVIFEPGQTLRTLRLTALQDEIDETEETALFTFVSVNNARIPTVSVPIKIIDGNEHPTLTLTSVSTLEDTPNGGILFELSLSHPSASALALTYATEDETAVSGQDYVAATGRLVFEPGQRNKTLRVDLIDDALFEGDETFALSIAFEEGPPENNPAQPQRVLAQIEDDETPPQMLAQSTPTSEGSGSIAVFLSLDRTTTIPLTFAYETLDRGAVAGSDYIAAKGTLEFSPNQRSEIIFIDLMDDALREGQEDLTLRLFLSGEDKTLVAPTEALLQIIDNDPLPFIRAEGLIISEDEGGDGRVKMVDYRLTLDAPSAQQVEVSYATVFDGEADASDMTPQEGTLIFAPGEREASLTLEIHQDSLAEGDETLTLAFSRILNARISNPRVQLTLRETKPPRLTIAPAEAREGDDLAFDLSLSPISPRPLYLLYSPVDAAGLPIGHPQSFILGAGEKRATLRVPTDDNDVDEEDRALRFLIRVADDSPLKLEEERLEVVGLILDDEPDPILSVSASKPLVEGQEGTLILRLEGKTRKTSIVTLRIRPSSEAQAGEDVEQLGQPLSLQDLLVPTQIPLVLMDDTLNEKAEAIELEIDGEGVTLAVDQASLTIADNDPLPILSTERLTLKENSPTPPTLSLNTPSGRDLRLKFTVEDEQAVAGKDFQVLHTEVLIPTGETNIPLPIELMDDPTFELTEDFTLSITEAEFIDVPEARIPMRIIDNDPAPRLSATLKEATEGDAGILSLRLDAASAIDTVLALRLIGGTSQQDRDFDLTNQHLIVPAGETQAEIRIPYLADGIFEGIETLRLDLGMIQGAQLMTQQLTGRILDADAPPTILITDRAFLETTDDEILLDVQAFGAFENPIELTYTLTSETAQAGEDFIAKTGTLTITPDLPEGFITLQLLDDLTPEGPERFTLRLFSEPQVDLPTRPVSIEIIDNELYTQP